MKVFYLFFLMLFPSIFLGQSSKNIYEEATERDLKKIAVVFEVTQEQHDKIFDLLYGKYKFYYGMSEKPGKEKLDAFKKELEGAIEQVLNIEKVKYTPEQKNILNQITIYKTEF